MPPHPLAPEASRMRLLRQFPSSCTLARGSRRGNKDYAGPERGDLAVQRKFEVGGGGGGSREQSNDPPRFLSDGRHRLRRALRYFPLSFLRPHIITPSYTMKNDDDDDRDCQTPQNRRDRAIVPPASILSREGEKEKLYFFEKSSTRLDHDLSSHAHNTAPGHPSSKYRSIA